MMRPHRSTARAVAVGLAALACAVGCRDRRTIDELESTLAQLDVEPSPEVVHDPLASGVDRLRRLFAPDAVEVLRDGPHHLEDRAFVDVSVTLEGSGCYALGAWGLPQSADLDLRLDGTDGLPIAADTAPDAFPVLVDRCVQSDGVYNVRLTATAGPVDAMLAVWRDPDDARRDAADALAAMAAHYAPDATPMGAVQQTELLEGQRYEVPLALTPDACVMVVARHGGPAGADLDLEARDASGSIVARDLGTEREAVLPALCADAGAAWRVTLRAYAADGPIWWQTWSRDPAVARGADSVAP